LELLDRAAAREAAVPRACLGVRREHELGVALDDPRAGREERRRGAVVRAVERRAPGSDDAFGRARAASAAGGDGEEAGREREWAHSRKLHSAQWTSASATTSGRSRR